MAACEVCGDASHLSHDCRYCNGAYCTDHLLPENHDCVAVGGAVTLGPEFRHVGSREATADAENGEDDTRETGVEAILNGPTPTHDCPECGEEIAVTRPMCAECRIGSSDDEDDTDPVPKHDCEGCGKQIATTRNVCSECLAPSTDDTTAQYSDQTRCGYSQRIIAAALLFAAALYIVVTVLG